MEEWVPIYLKLYERFGFASVHHNLSISLNKHLHLWERNKGILAVEKKNMVPISDFSRNCNKMTKIDKNTFAYIRWPNLTGIILQLHIVILLQVATEFIFTFACFL